MSAPFTASLRRLILSVLVGVVVLAVVAPSATALRAIEPFGTYQPQVSCDPVAKPGVVAFRALVLRRFGGGDLGIVRDCGVGSSSEHKEGRAWDYALNYYNSADRARAKAATSWLLQPVGGDPARRAKRLGVMYMIWNGKIWSASRAAEGWRTYTGASPHRDHVHFSLTWNGATQKTSWWTGQVMPVDYGPCPRWQGELAPAWRAPRLTPCPPPLRRPAADTAGYYVAQPGETVRRVAQFFGVTGAEVRAWNGFPARGPVALSVGQRIRVVHPSLTPPPSQTGEPGTE